MKDQIDTKNDAMKTKRLNKPAGCLRSIYKYKPGRVTILVIYWDQLSGQNQAYLASQYLIPLRFLDE